MKGTEYRGRRRVISTVFSCIVLSLVNTAVFLCLVHYLKIQSYFYALFTGCFFLLTASILLSFLKFNPPFILKEEGIWVDTYGLLPWCIIRGMAHPCAETGNRVVLVIRSPEEIRQTALSEKQKKEFSRTSTITFYLKKEEEFSVIFQWYQKYCC